jgi:non-specific serine/threonine protein kinase
MPARRQQSRLPAEPTSFVGRRAELARLTTIIDQFRIVTVTGAGGVGKTRLVRQAAPAVTGLFPDGVCVVELSSLRVPGLLPNTVGTALGLAGLKGRQALDALLDYLRDRSMLLILDTCEHLTEACGEFAITIAAKAPKVTILATSRQPLGVPKERVFPLLPLPVPEDGASVTDGDAADLFVQRAASAVPGFALTDANREHVLTICRRLAGIPLALELAAVRLRALSVRELVEGFGLDIATGTRRTALSRHRDLKTAIGWSYELCTGQERVLWRRLSVFAGSFGFEAADEVCGDSSLDTDEIEKAVDGLVRKSVLTEVKPSHIGDEYRFRLLDPIREFGARELNGSGAMPAVRSRYIAYYLGMARRFGKNAVSGDQLTRYTELRQEHANIRAAMEYAFAMPGNERAAIDIATSMFLFWHMSGMAWEGEYWVNRGLELVTPTSPLRARLLATRAYLLCILGEIGPAQADATAAIKAAERLGDTDTVARAYGALHRALTWGDDLASASSIADMAFGLLKDADDQLGLAQFDMQEIFADLQARDPVAAVTVADRGLARLPPGELWARGYLLMQKGISVFVTGDQTDGAAMVRRALIMKHELSDVVGVAYCVGVLGLMAADQERYSRAVYLLGAAETHWELAGRRYTGSPYLEEWHQRALASARGHLGSGEFQASWDRGTAAGPDARALFAVRDVDGPALVQADDAQAG